MALDFSIVIQDWAKSNLPTLWQHSLLKYLAQGKTLTQERIREFANAAVNESKCAKEYWFTEPHFAKGPTHKAKLDAKHFGIVTSDEEPIRLTSVKHCFGVNRLSEGAVLNFDPGATTVVFGANGSGKSGYTRILKKFAASRGIETILPNVFEPSSREASAEISFTKGTKHLGAKWIQGQDSVESDFQRVRVFDSKAATTHIGEPNRLAYVPPQMAVLSRFAEALGEIKQVIEREQILQRESFSQWRGIENDRFNDLVNDLGSLNAKQEINRTQEFSETRSVELDNLRKKHNQLKADSPETLLNRTGLRIESAKKMQRRILEFENFLEAYSVERARELSHTLAQTEKDLERLRVALNNVDRFTLTENRAWLPLWKAMEELIDDLPDNHNLKHQSPSLWEVCPACQQDLDDLAIERFTEFSRFARSSASYALEHAREDLEKFKKNLGSLEITTSEDAARAEIGSVARQLELDSGETDALEKQYVDWCEGLRERKAAVERVLVNDSAVGPDSGGGISTASENEGSRHTEEPSEVVKVSESAQLLEMISKILERFEKEKSRLEKLLPYGDGQSTFLSRISELRYEELMAIHHKALKASHDRALEIQAQGQAIGQCNPQKVTNLVRKLSNEYVQEISERFKVELGLLGFDNRVPVELALDKTSRGASYIKTSFKSDGNESNNPVDRILSEGEQRIVAIAGFFADLTGSDDRSCLIFDDPVSSLDHRFRSKVAVRLIQESARRQVVIFTHDYAFVQLLQQARLEESLTRTSQELEQLPEIKHLEIFSTEVGTGSLKTGDWRRNNLGKQIRQLKDLYYRVEALSRKEPDRYPGEARAFLGAIRETWERLVEETLLNGVVRRFDKAVHTRQLSVLSDIQDTDLATIEKGMTTTSRLLQGHSAPGEVSHEKYPDIGVVEEQLSLLVDLHETINRRRSRDLKR